MDLLALVLRAAAVALMAATLLLPIADHHTAARLPELGLRHAHHADASPAPRHHHPRGEPRLGSGPSVVIASPLPVLLPLAPAAPGHGSAVADAPAPATFFALGGVGFLSLDPSIPDTLAAPPPKPPPILPA